METEPQSHCAVNPDEIFRAKEERRRKLAALPLAEKVKLIEFLHDVGIELRRLKKEGKIRQLTPEQARQMEAEHQERARGVTE